MTRYRLKINGQLRFSHFATREKAQAKLDAKLAQWREQGFTSEPVTEIVTYTTDAPVRCVGKR